MHENGSIYSFGEGEYGKLGQGYVLDQLTPKKIDILTEFNAIAAGGQHSLILDGNHNVLSSGNGYYGRLGQGNNIDLHSHEQILNKALDITTPDVPTNSTSGIMAIINRYLQLL